jgi:hypothetical protein
VRHVGPRPCYGGLLRMVLRGEVTNAARGTSGARDTGQRRGKEGGRPVVHMRREIERASTWALGGRGLQC